MIYFVSPYGSDSDHGSNMYPFRTINHAAKVAVAGDEVCIREGVYREWIDPKNTGISDNRRITYAAAPYDKVIVKGSECVRDWEPLGDGVWKVVLNNEFFGDWNPYKEEVKGDWLVEPQGRSVHCGCVYLNGKAFYEAESLEALKNPVIKEQIIDNWTRQTVPVADPEQTKYLWYAEVDESKTTIYANFSDRDPNRSLVEINVRKCCLYPSLVGRDYITVKNIEFCHAATPWAPPTGDQPGMVGPHWAKGWIIENCILHDAKCSAISIGKEASTGENFRSYRKDKPGYQYQLEAVFSALKVGWSKEHIGSHIIRDNRIYDCGQNAIVGHLGCIFSQIYCNHIFNIGIRREFYGHEIAGIKLHAAIDTQIYNNYIHDCSLGIWLDWQAQGTRVSKNVFVDNCRDLFVEVSHGPYVVDHNFFSAQFALDNHAQGGAYIRNVFAGKIFPKKMLDRATPYHAPHSTDVAGYAFTYGADDRFYGNIFIGGRTDALVKTGYDVDPSSIEVGTAIYDNCPKSLREYIEKANETPGDHELFHCMEQPAYILENVYLEGAKPYAREWKKLVADDFVTGYKIIKGEDYVSLEIDLPEGFTGFTAEMRDTSNLERVRIVDADFENPDGSELKFDTDFFEEKWEHQSPAGPLASLKAGHNSVKLIDIRNRMHGLFKNYTIPQVL